MADERFELPAGALEMMVLRSLSAGALHGYAIVRSIRDRSADLLQVEEGSLYPALHRMERRGWVDAEWGTSESNRRAKYYRLTRAGRSELKVRVATWGRLSGAIAQVLDPRPLGMGPLGHEA